MGTEVQGLCLAVGADRQLWPARPLTRALQGSPCSRGFFPRADSSKHPELTGDAAKPHVFTCSSSHIALELLEAAVAPPCLTVSKSRGKTPPFSTATAGAGPSLPSWLC